MSTESVSFEKAPDVDFETGQVAPSITKPHRILRILFWLALGVLTAVGAYYRFKNLELKPFHHDEGVNGWFILRILDESKYRYNPKNYHGPLLYFLNTLAVFMGGRTVAAMRFMPALFGTLAIPAMALFRRQLGLAGVLVAAAYVALAPVEVYFSRTIIHEIYNFTFNIGLVGGVVAFMALRYRNADVEASRGVAAKGSIAEPAEGASDNVSPTTVVAATAVPTATDDASTEGTSASTTVVEKKSGASRAAESSPGPLARVGSFLLARRQRYIVLVILWLVGLVVSHEGFVTTLWVTTGALAIALMLAHMLVKEQKYLVLASVSLICLFGTKETTIITLCAVLGALVLALMVAREPLPGPFGLAMEGGPVSRFKIIVRYLTALAKAEKKMLMVAAIAALVIWALIFSSLFTYPRGLGAFFEAFYRWGETGVEGKGHQKPWSYFFTHLLWPYYRPLVFFGTIGLIWGSIRRERFALFVTGWLSLALIAYSTIPYKTPWCVLSFSAPLFIGLGLAVRYMLEAVRRGSWWVRVPNGLGLIALLGLLIPFGVPMPESIREMLQPPKHVGAEVSARLRQLPQNLARLFIPGTDSWTINFEEYDVKGHPFIYVQNVREYLFLINDLHGLIETAQLKGDEEQPRILMIDAKNPMRWYLQKTGTQEWRKELNDATKKMIPDDVDIVCLSKQFIKEAKDLFGDDFILRKYHERPGRKIEVYVRKSLWDAYLEAAEEGVALEPSPDFKRRSFSDRRTTEMRDTWSKRGMN